MLFRMGRKKSRQVQTVLKPLYHHVIEVKTNARAIARNNRILLLLYVSTSPTMSLNGIRERHTSALFVTFMLELTFNHWKLSGLVRVGLVDVIESRTEI